MSHKIKNEKKKLKMKMKLKVTEHERKENYLIVICERV